MNIAAFAWEFAPFINGGLGRFVEYYTKHLTEDGHKIWAFASNTGKLEKKKEYKNLVLYRPLNRLMKAIIPWRVSRGLMIIYYNIASYMQLRKIVKNTKIDVISVHDWMNCLVGILCTVTFRIPVVFHVHSTENTMVPWNKKNVLFKIIAVFERLMASRASKIIVASEQMHKLLVEHGWSSSKIRVVPYGHDNSSAIFSSEKSPVSSACEIRSKINALPDEKILLFVGRLIYSKGIFQLLKAMPLVVKTNPKIKLVLVGAGDKEKVDLLIHTLGLSNNVFAYHRFLGVNEVAAHYLMSDICIFPSLYEPFGLVALEAMSLGKPVILGSGFSKIFGGSSENPTALLVDSKNPYEIAKAIGTLLDDPERSNKMGREAKEYVKNSFDWNLSLIQTVEEYRQAIAGR
ncbi:MAG TPA: glycosyltransferase family 4 protein [Pseudobacteroides sp.]|uniref:glycosyltransferase family 4 protein n=1 Tax=Pseudobacteroides sp. TaxID=1968840 RepID=UPI002F934F27